MSNEENSSLSDQLRRKCIIDYVRKHPECQKETVISYCTKIGEGSRVTLGNSINDLIKEGILNEGKEKKNSKSYKLTVVSENLLLIIPQGLEDVFSRLSEFTKVVKKCIEQDDEHVSSRPTDDIISRMNNYIAKNSLPFLPYYVTEIVNNLYTFYFNFVLPRKIEEKNFITKLYFLYFENLSKIYSSILLELGDNFLDIADLSTVVKSNLYQYDFVGEHPGLNPVYRTARLCRIIGIEEDLYKVLDLLWIKNEECCTLLYTLNEEQKPNERNILNNKQNKKIMEIIYKNQLRENKMLAKIHTLIDLYIYQQEEDEKE